MEFGQERRLIGAVRCCEAFTMDTESSCERIRHVLTILATSHEAYNVSECSKTSDLSRQTIYQPQSRAEIPNKRYQRQTLRRP